MKSPTSPGRQALQTRTTPRLAALFLPLAACFTDRKLAAVRAYHEWLPIRQVDADDKLRIWRNFQIGKLLDLTMLDTRQYDRDLTDVSDKCLAYDEFYLLRKLTFSCITIRNVSVSLRINLELAERTFPDVNSMSDLQ